MDKSYWIVKCDSNTYRVCSDALKTYEVQTGHRSRCSCPHFTNRLRVGQRCKHIKMCLYLKPDFDLTDDFEEWRVV